MTWAIVQAGLVMGFIQKWQVPEGEDPAAKFALPDGATLHVITEQRFEELYKGPMSDGRGAYLTNKGEIEPRPLMNIERNKDQIVADGADFFELHNLPEGAEVFVDDEIATSAAAGGGKCKVSADSPGSYSIRVECWPYVPTFLTLEAI